MTGAARPATPPPGETGQAVSPAVTRTCRNGHRRTATNSRLGKHGYVICLDCRAAYDQRQWDRRHGSHDVEVWADGRRVCNTCACDPAAVDRAVAGDPPPSLTRIERRQVVLALAKQGLPAREIALRARCSQRQVWRIRRRAREAGAGVEGRGGVD